MTESATAAADPLLGGRYRVQQRVAHGELATVYVAVDIWTNKRVAVKVFGRAAAAVPVDVTRLYRQVALAARYSDHPNIATIFDVGRDVDDIFVVSELVLGRPLNELLASEGALPPARAMAVLISVLEALAAIHAAGVLHLNLKPENVLIDEEGKVKLTADFGLSTTIRETDGVLGTPGYSPPEVLGGAPPSPRSDVYAAGVLLFVMLTSRQPFEGTHMWSVVRRQFEGPAPAPSSVSPDVPTEFDELVLRATEPDPVQRPADARAMLELLQEIAAVFPLKTAVVPVARKRRTALLFGAGRVFDLSGSGYPRPPMDPRSQLERLGDRLLIQTTSGPRADD